MRSGLNSEILHIRLPNGREKVFFVGFKISRSVTCDKTRRLLLLAALIDPLKKKKEAAVSELDGILTLSEEQRRASEALLVGEHAFA